jgi:hypothetical protein
MGNSVNEAGNNTIVCAETVPLKGLGPLMHDAEILARYPEDGIIILDKLDHHAPTQRMEGSGKRDRGAVESWIKANGYAV